MSGPKYVAIGLCLWFSAMMMLVGVLVAVHEAMRVEAGQGDSVNAVVGLMFIFPAGVALGIVGAVKVYHLSFPAGD